MKKIDYYGNNDNYIHLKFGNCIKMYNFTADFTEKYPDFAREYTKYFEGKISKFKGPFAVVAYVYDNNIPLSFYFNFTDTPAENREEIMEYLVNENSYVGDLSEMKKLI